MSRTIHNVTGDIYIGRGSGKRIIEDMLAAKKSIRVMSPYLSAKLVDVLLERFGQGIDVELVTSGEIEDHKHTDDKNCYKMIRQHRHVDQQLKHRKELFSWFGIACTFLFGWIALMKLLRVFDPAVTWADYAQLAFFAALALGGEYVWKQGRNMRFWYYSYSSLFPIKIFHSYFSGKRADRSRAFNLHSKLYIIDDCIAYLGSVNFTRSGSFFNHETRIRFTDPGAIRELKAEFEELLYTEQYHHLSVHEWGKELYEEN